MSLRIPPTTCISHEQNVKEQCSRENMLLQIVQNLTPNKANLTQVACKSQKKFPLNLFKLRQVRPENSIFYYNLTSQVSSLKYWAGFQANDPRRWWPPPRWWQRANTCNTPRFSPRRNLTRVGARQIGINRRDLSNSAPARCPLHIFSALHFTFWTLGQCIAYHLYKSCYVQCWGLSTQFECYPML